MHPNGVGGMSSDGEWHGASQRNILADYKSQSSPCDSPLGIARGSKQKRCRIWAKMRKCRVGDTDDDIPSSVYLHCGAHKQLL